MRPLHLSMTAFGPFQNEENIDFTLLGENPLFLINGPTGSGKSTILDGICYALYGQTTGNERDGNEMRCDQSDEDILTSVTLNFELGDKHYVITRTPEQERPKKKGEGMLIQASEANLYLVDDEDEKLLAGPKITHVNETIINITGLSGEQFRQVMVLPQGQFRKLLTAKSTEREEIFQKLFSTDTYRLLQDRLKSKANELKRQLADIDIKQAAMLSAQDIENSDKLEEELKELTASLEGMDRKRKEARDALSKIQKKLHDIRTVEQLFIDQESAKAHYEILVEKAPENKKDKERLSEAKKAKEIEPIYIELNKNKKSLETILTDIQVETQRLNEADKALSELDEEKKALPEKTKKIEGLTANITDLEKIVVLVSELDGLQQICKSSEQAKSTADNTFTSLQKKVQKAKDVKDKSEKSLREGMTSVAILPEKRQSLEVMKEQGKQLKEKETAKAVCDRIEQEAKTLEQSQIKSEEFYQKQHRQLELMEMAWNNGQAALLAKDLKDGDSCPVCGSTEHPNITVSSDKLPTEDERTEVRKNVDDAREALEVIKRDYAAKEQELKTSLLQLNALSEKVKDIESINIEQRREEYATCQEEIKVLVATEENNKTLENIIDETTKSLDIDEGELKQTQTLVDTTKTAHTVALTNYQNKLDAIPDEYQEIGKATAALEEFKQEHHKLKESVEGFTQRHQTSRDAKIKIEAGIKAHEENKERIDTFVTASMHKWKSSLKENKFKNETMFASMLMGKVEQDALEQRIREYDDNAMLAKEKLDDTTAVTKDKKRLNITQFEVKESELATQKEIAEQTYHQSEGRYNSLTKLKASLGKSLKEKVTLENEYGVVGRLSNVANGDNLHNTSLQRFVLSVLLDDVLVSANVRLMKMSHHRYELYRSEIVEDKRQQAGLDIMVQDNISGSQRSVDTLSGGESFQAALALALGLSDTVQSYSGGIRLDTLFIDEGFGSLDGESLENAINILLELNESGRMVGIISHIENVNQMIDVKLNVISDRGISHTSMTLV